MLTTFAPKAALEKMNKELNVRVVDLETKSIADAPRPATSRRLESRIEELTNRLHQESSAKSEKDRMHRTADKSVKDVQFQLMESDRQRLRLEEDVKAYEAKVQNLRDQQKAAVSASLGVGGLNLTLEYPGASAIGCGAKASSC